eukprot:scaffold79446_cov33-Tisochrysis_lutea.AAC.2
MLSRHPYSSPLALPDGAAFSEVRRIGAHKNARKLYSKALLYANTADLAMVVASARELEGFLSLH